MKKLAALALVAGTVAFIGPHANAKMNDAQAQTKQLVQAALKEGSLSYWDGVIQPHTADDLVAAFRKRYGLPASFAVHVTGFSPSILVTRLRQELRANRVNVDAVSIASLPLVYHLVKTDKILKYDSPEYKNYEKIFSANFGKKDYFAFNGAYTFVPMWDSSKTHFNGKTWNDVLAALKEHRFSVCNGATSDSCISTYIGLRKGLGLAYMKKLAAKKPVFLAKSETIASRLISGEDLMAFMGMPTRAYQFNKKGAHLKFLFPRRGVVLLPQASFILKAAAHPAAAKLWINFMLSEEGQEIFVRDEAMISGREGFKSPIPEYAPPIDTIHLIHVNWANVPLAKLQSARKQWDHIFGQ